MRLRRLLTAAWRGEAPLEPPQSDRTSGPAQLTRVDALPDVPSRLTEQLRSYSQGDVLTGVSTIAVGLSDGLLAVNCPHGVVVISQTCDVVQPSRASVQVAAIVVLTGNAAKEAWARKRPRFVPVPALNLRETQASAEASFADLEIVGTLPKGQLASCSRVSGVTSDEDVRNFGRDVARRYGRFPFPDEVTPWLIPLESIVQSKYARPTSPEGRLLRLVDSLRVHSSTGWEKAPYALTLQVILQPGALPSFDDEPDIPTDLARWFEAPETLPKPGPLAEQILSEYGREAGEQDLVRVYWLWVALAQAWAAQCRLKWPDRETPEVRSALVDGKLVADVESADTYSLVRYRESVELDLDHLSAPLPRDPS